MSSRKAASRKQRNTRSELPTSAMNAQPTTPEPTMTLLRRVAAELLGTFLLVLFHGGAAASLRMIQSDSTTIVGIAFLALIDGFSLFIIIMIVGRISGVLINPAVTIGLAIGGRFPWREVPPYLTAQFLGAAAGATMIIAAIGHKALIVGHLGAVHLGPGVSIWQGALVEMLGAFFLMLTISATAEDPRLPSGWAPFSIGMSFTAIVLLFEPITGAPANPARAFGPNLLDSLLNVPVNWGNYIVCYLVSPIIGATIATTLYRFMANLPKKNPAPEPD